MACHTAHGVSVVVMHFGTQNSPAPGTALGGRKFFHDRLEPAPPHDFQVDERGRAQPQGVEDFAPAVLIKLETADRFYGCAEQHEPQVAIDGPLPGWGLKLLAL